MERIRARGIIHHKGKFLLVKNAAAGGFWCLPGGTVESGEDIISALSRELVEELNVKPKIGNLIYVHQIKHDNMYSFPAFYFHITNPGDFLKYDISASTHGQDELEDIGWVDVTKEYVLPRTLSTELPGIAQDGFNTKTRIILD